MNDLVHIQHHNNKIMVELQKDSYALPVIDGFIPVDALVFTKVSRLIRIKYSGLIHTAFGASLLASFLPELTILMPAAFFGFTFFSVVSALKFSIVSQDVKNFYATKVSEWLTESTGMLFDWHTVNEVTSILFESSKTHNVIVTESGVRLTVEQSSVNHPSNPAQHHLVWCANVENSQMNEKENMFSLDTSASSETSKFSVSSEALESVKDKILVAKNNAVSVADKSIVEHIQQQVDDAVQYAGQLKDLDDPDYLEVLDIVMNAVSSELDFMNKRMLNRLH